MEIVPGIYRVDNVRGSNVYLLANHELVLIDTGLPGNTNQIIRFIKEIGGEPESRTALSITLPFLLV